MNDGVYDDLDPDMEYDEFVRMTPKQRYRMVLMQLQEVYRIAEWSLRKVEGEWHPFCPYCERDAAECSCPFGEVRKVLGIIPPVDEEGCILDFDAFERAVERALKE